MLVVGERLFLEKNQWIERKSSKVLFPMDSLWIDFHKVQEFTKSARFAQTPSSYIDLDFHRLFKGKGKIFWYQIIPNILNIILYSYLLAI